MSGSGRGPAGCLGVFERPSGMSGSDKEASLMSGSGWKTLSDVREWS